MTLSVRARILLTVAPLVLLVAAVGVGGVALLHNLGRRSEEILRENYRSVQYMAGLKERLRNAEQLVLIALSQRDQVHPTVQPAFRQAVLEARDYCRLERGNITLPGEGLLAQELSDAVDEVGRRGEQLFALPSADRQEYFTRPDTGFQSAVTQALDDASVVEGMNEEAMHAADHASRDTARWSGWVLGVAAGAAVLLATCAVWWLQRTLLAPVRSMTAAARAIGDGDLQQLVPVVTADEMGELAVAFNTMAARLRAYRQTDQDQLNRARRAAQATVDSFPDPVLVLDPGGRVEVANPAAVRLFGVVPAGGAWPPPEPVRTAVEEAVRTNRPVLAEGFDRAVTFSLAGEEHAYLPQVRPIAAADGEPLGVAVVLHDITRFRLLDQLKSDWVATVSHELKTPLTGVQLAVHVLLEEVVGPLTPKQTELLLEARTGADRLLALVHQLLALAKLEDDRRAFDRQPTDPGTLLRTAADAVASRAEDKHVAVTVVAPPDLPPVAVDPARFGQALNNLLDNAVTHTPAGGTVTLTAATSDGLVSLVVADTGVGIPPADLPHVFERFFRVSGRDAPGTGLGLAIVREVVEGHGGSIRCESAVGNGTSFVITLPAGETA